MSDAPATSSVLSPSSVFFRDETNTRPAYSCWPLILEPVRRDASSQCVGRTRDSKGHESRTKHNPELKHPDPQFHCCSFCSASVFIASILLLQGIHHELNASQEKVVVYHGLELNNNSFTRLSMGQRQHRREPCNR